jgi:hypothetical protein
MSYSQHRHAHILELNGQPLDPYAPILRRTASEYLYDPTNPTTLSQPKVQKRFEVIILDLYGNPVRRGEPHPTLRRTASGNLFQPHPSSVHECELQDARSLTPDSPDTPSAMVPDIQVEYSDLPASTCTSLTRKHGNRQLNTQATLRPAPAKQAQVFQPKSGSSSETLGRQRSMIATMETASSETLHGNARYRDVCAQADSPRHLAVRRNNKSLIESATPYSLRHVGNTPDLRNAAILQGVSTTYAGNANTTAQTLGQHSMAESQNPNGLCQGFGLATYEERERYRRKAYYQSKSHSTEPRSSTTLVSTLTVLELPGRQREDPQTLMPELEPVSPTSSTVVVRRKLRSLRLLRTRKLVQWRRVSVLGARISGCRSLATNWLQTLLTRNVRFFLTWSFCMYRSLFLIFIVMNSPSSIHLTPSHYIVSAFTQRAFTILWYTMQFTLHTHWSSLAFTPPIPACTTYFHSLRSTLWVYITLNPHCVNTCTPRRFTANRPPPIFSAPYFKIPSTDINMSSGTYGSFRSAKHMYEIAQMEACTVPWVKRVGNLRAAFQEVHRSALPVLNRVATAGIFGYAEHGVENVSFRATCARPVVRQDSFIVLQPSFTKPPTPPALVEDLQAFSTRQDAQSVQIRDTLPTSDTVHEVTFSFADIGLNLALPNHVSPLAVQNYKPSNDTTASRRWSQPGDWLYDGEKVRKYHFKYWKVSPDNREWTWEVDQIDHRLPEPVVQRIVSQTTEKLHFHYRQAGVFMHMRELPCLPDWYECCNSNCKLGCAAKVPKVPKGQL